MNLICFSGAGNPNKRANPRDEPKLHRIQIPPDQSSSMDQGKHHLICYIKYSFLRSAEHCPSLYLLLSCCEEHIHHLCLVFQVFKPRTPPEAITLCSRLLEYTPASRFSPFEACSHAFFDELRQPNTRLPNGRELPLLFNFSPTGSEIFVFELIRSFK